MGFMMQSKTVGIKGMHSPGGQWFVAETIKRYKLETHKKKKKKNLNVIC